MRLNLLGVRGSTPAPGESFTRYGGNTSCVAVTADGDSRPTLTLDAGTGLRSLSALLRPKSYNGAILLTHLHWDHMHGLPFFTAGDQEDSNVHVYVPAQDGRSGEQLLAQSMSPPSFPISPGGLNGSWKFTAVEPGTYTVGSFSVVAAEVHHKGGRTFGYRLSDEAGSIAYVPDHVARGGVTPELDSLAGNVDVLLHDAQFVEAERSLADAYGHSTIDDAIELAVRLDVKRLVLFHHSPVRTDDELDAIGTNLDSPVPVEIAREGQVFDVPLR